MSPLRSALRPAARLAMVTSLVATPAAAALGVSAHLTDVTDLAGTLHGSLSVADSTSVTHAASTGLGGGLGGVSAATARAGTAPDATRAAARPAINRVMIRPGSRVSRSGTRVVPSVAWKPMRSAAPVVLQEKQYWSLPVAGYRLTGRFGNVSALWSSGSHTGLDFAAPTGTPIRSVAEGVVKSAGYDGSYGYKTVVTLPDGRTVWYCHQNQVSVQPGDRLDAGQVLGYVGATGNVTGSHLHLEIRDGDVPLDPATYLARQGVTP